MRHVGHRELTAAEQGALDAYFERTLPGLIDAILERGFGTWGLIPKHLTRRQIEIVQLWADGLDNVQIAAHLFISPHTVKVHASNIHQRLRSQTQAQAVAIAYERGVLGEGTHDDEPMEVP